MITMFGGFVFSAPNAAACSTHWTITTVAIGASVLIPCSKETVLKRFERNGRTLVITLKTPDGLRLGTKLPNQYVGMAGDDQLADALKNAD
jgi:hypothetical protein